MTTLSLPRSRRCSAAGSALQLVRTRRARYAAVLMESLEPRVMMTAALVQNVVAAAIPGSGTSPDGYAITNQSGPVFMNQFNPATGTLLGATVGVTTDAHLQLKGDIIN